MEKEKNKNFTKLKEKTEKTFEEFNSTKDLKLKNKAFNLYSKYIDKLAEIEETNQEIDDYIFECIVRAKEMRKQITVNPMTEGIVSKMMRVFLLEQEPNMKWGDIIGLKLHREIFLNKLILPSKRKKFEDAEKKILLFGGPGTGKTVLAKAMAYETEYTFFNVHCSDLIQKSVLNNGLEIVKELFSSIRKYQPCIVFFDEFELLFLENSSSEIQFLSEMLWDKIASFQKEDNVCFFVATNQPWLIPKYIFDGFSLKLILDVPDQETRVAFLSAKFKEAKLNLSQEFIEDLALRVKG